MSEAAVRSSQSAGPLGPVALSGGLLLLFMSPLMRGGNRHVALIALEVLGLVVLVALWARFSLTGHPSRSDLTSQPLLVPLLMSPLLLAVLQLTPLPAAWWQAMPGHAVYADALDILGLDRGGWRPLSVNPEATTASLLAAIPWVAAFLLAYLASLSQLRMLMRVVVGVAFLQVVLGLLQASGGQHSPLYFGVMTYGPPVGTFANRNHFANYLAMALAAYIWLAYEATHGSERSRASRARLPGAWTSRHVVAFWTAGGLVLVLGILLSRSRGAVLFGLSMAGVALAVAAFRLLGWSRGWRFATLLGVALVFAAAAIVGFDEVTSRMSADQLFQSASFRSQLASTSLTGAWAFWPWGSGWGTYEFAYQRFQPPTLPVYPNHAHQDYVEMLFEGGIFFVAIATGFLWLAVRRTWLLYLIVRKEGKLHSEAMAAALCGLGLLGLLLHSLVEFNMRIPANAILGALLAGAFLRPLSKRRRRH
jgi:hypothetical protein